MAGPSEQGFEILRRDEEFTLYRRQSPGEPSVLALGPTRTQPPPQTVERLAHEYALAPELDASWAARPFALTQHHGQPTLLLEDCGGEPLDQVLARDGALGLDLPRVLRLADALASVLGAVHGRGLVHKDVKPAHVLVIADGDLRLTGFGIASRLRRERPLPSPPDKVAGTLAYMAPEQTGRMNRSVDARSDLYALGVTLYEVLTGAPPFAAADPMEWIHCHLARQPAPPSERVPGLPAVVDAIVLKLLAKDPEDRYQTAAGLGRDLRRCLRDWELRGDVAPFAPGEDDFADRLVIPEKLYGREAQVEALVAAFDQMVVRGRPELVVVCGSSGTGKSSLVSEVHRILVPSRGLFAGGKSDQYKRDVPYGILAQAFRGLVLPLLRTSEPELARWRGALLEAVGPNGQLVVNLVPELVFVIGEQPPIADLAPGDTQKRFRQVLRRFIDVFARPEHPLALFLDDLQWADPATLELLRGLSTDVDARHLLLVVAYRDNEVDAVHPLTLTLADVRASGARVVDIAVGPLTLVDITRLLADALHAEPHRVRPLATLTLQKTGGNAFFVLQFVTSLYEQGLLALDAAGLAWRWNIHRIRAQRITENVADLVSGKLSRLPEASLRAVKDLACLGSSARTPTIAAALGVSEEEVHATLRKAAREGLVVGVDDVYAFVHDRVHEAAYALLELSERQAAHERIASRLLEALGSADIGEQLFDIVTQFNRGPVSGAGRDRRQRVAALNLQAARKAKAAAAYGAACGFLAAGADLLGPEGWADCYALTFELTLERAGCTFLVGEFEATADLVATLLRHAATKAEAAAVYRLKIELHVVRAENRQAIASALDCLRLFGWELPASPNWDDVQREYALVWEQMGGRSIESLADLPAMSDPELRAVMRMLAEAIAPAYFADFNLTALLTCRMVNLSLVHGSTDAAVQGYAWFGLLLGPAFGRFDEGFRFAECAYALVSTRDVPLDTSRSLLMKALTSSWTRPLTTSIEEFRASFRAGIEADDPYFSSYAGANVGVNLLMRGDDLRLASEECGRYLEFATKIGFEDAVSLIRCSDRVFASLRGLTRSLSSFADADFDERAFEAQLTGDRMTTLIYWYWTKKVMVHFLAGEYEAALTAADKAQPSPRSRLVHIQILDHHFYSALTLAALCDTTSDAVRGGMRARLEAHRTQLEVWAALTGAATFRDRHTLVSAEAARVDGRHLDAMRLYEEAIGLSREYGFVQHEALAHELAARFHAALGYATAADAHLRNAHLAYLRWGALGKVRQLEELHPQLREESIPTVSPGTIGSAAQLDAETVVRAAQTLSSEMLMPSLVETLMRLAVEHAGAERGVLVFLHGDAPYLETEATTGRGRVDVTVRRVRATPADAPEAVLQYVLRTGERVVLDDALTGGLPLDDGYVRERRPRSVLCLPIVRHTRTIGALYLENSLATHAFTADRVAVLEFLASQAAISLENARLYSGLRRSEALLKEAQHLSGTGSFAWRVDLDVVEYSAQTYRTYEFDPELPVTLDLIATRIHPDDIPLLREMIDIARGSGDDLDYHYRLRMPDESVKHLHLVAHGTRDEDGRLEYIGAIQDVTQQRHAETALGRVRSELAYVARVSSLGVLTASIAHEVNQPLTGILSNAGTSVRHLTAEPPNIVGALESARRTMRDGHRASDVITRLRALFAKDDVRAEVVDLNEATREVLALAAGELQRGGVVARADLADDIPGVVGDRVQLQQVILNLLLNASEAMSGVEHRSRQVVVRTARWDGEHVRLSVEDAGIGFPPEGVEQLFDAFYTTKGSGMGIGLSISRAIIESHQGSLWAAPNDGPGATFSFSIPCTASGADGAPRAPAV